MSNHPTRLGARWWPRAIAVVASAAALVLGAATEAQAHNVLVGTSPADGSTSRVVPAQVTLTFNEPVLALGTEVIVTGPSGQVQSGAAVLVNNTVTEHLLAGSPAGLYTVIWRVTSADGHPVSGKLSFTATSPSPGQRPSAAAAKAPSTPPPAGVPAPAPTLWWVLAGGVLILLLLGVFIRTRKLRTSPHDERDPES